MKPQENLTPQAPSPSLYVRRKGMKIFLQIMALGLIPLLPAAGSSLADLLGPQIGLIEKIQGLSKKKDYAQIYALLGKDFTAVVSEEVFLRESYSIRWTIEKLTYGRINEHGAFAWVPIEGVTKTKKKEYQFHTVAFF